MEQVHLYKGEVAVMAGAEADHFFLVRHGRLTRVDINDKNSDYAENEMLGITNVLRRQAYRHTYVASLTTTLVKLDQSVITSRLAEQSKSFQALFGNIVGQLDGG
tara:strand:- start:2414 stop:2728 length:315 start_codon:yes stop_codon:yes gene_type:complete